MIEVYDAMAERQVGTKRSSAMGLTYDTYMYTVKQDSKLPM